jgi:uncharacterized membrane protein
MMALVPAWHPVVVHFPLALIVTAAFCLTAAFAVPKNRHAPALATVGTWNLCIGAVAVLVALATGLGAATGLHIDAAAHQAVSAHVKSAFVTAVLVLLATLWRSVGVPAPTRPSSVFMVLLWVATLSLLVTGYRGGQNVYVHGVGVEAAQVLPAK